MKAYEEEIGWHAKAAGLTPHEGPVALSITAIFPYPKSYKGTESPEPHVSRPDWDNIGKLVSDALNGIAWHDDSQVWVGTVKKVYGVEAGIHVVIDYLP